MTTQIRILNRPGEFIKQQQDYLVIDGKWKLKANPNGWLTWPKVWELGVEQGMIDWPNNYTFLQGLAHTWIKE